MCIRDRAELVAILEVYQGECECQCYRIRDCETTSSDFITYTDLSDLEENEVFRALNGTCYQLIGQSDCEVEGLNTILVTVDRRFGTENNACDCCLAPKYSLIPVCNACASVCFGEGGNDGEGLITDTDLSSFVGRLVKYEGDCYLVQESQGEVTLSDIEFTGPFIDCETCQQECISVVVGVRIEGTQLVMDTQEVIVLGSCGESTEVIVDLDPCEN